MEKLILGVVLLNVFLLAVMMFITWMGTRDDRSVGSNIAWVFAIYTCLLATVIGFQEEDVREYFKLKEKLSQQGMVYEEIPITKVIGHEFVLKKLPAEISPIYHEEIHKGNIASDSVELK